MSKGGNSISYEESNKKISKQNYTSNTNLSMVESNKKYINLLTKKIHYKYKKKQKMEVYMNYLPQNYSQWIF